MSILDGIGDLAVVLRHSIEWSHRDGRREVLRWSISSQMQSPKLLGDLVMLHK